MRFGTAELEYLGTLGWNDDFLTYLEEFRFSGDIDAMPEGTIAFADEPLVRVDRAADRRAAPGDPAAQPDQLPDDDRHQGRSGGPRRERQG
jgi:hypothetical protein